MRDLEIVIESLVTQCLVGAFASAWIYVHIL